MIVFLLFATNSKVFVTVAYAFKAQSNTILGKLPPRRLPSGKLNRGKLLLENCPQENFPMENCPRCKLTPLCITADGNILASGNISLKLFMAPLETVELLTI